MKIELDSKYQDINSWCFVEARKILAKIDYRIPEKGYVLFEAGYGPSGLPHLGTFGDVARVNYVKIAFSKLAPNVPTKLIVVSDDMDALRKVPDNVPNREMLKENLGKSLNSIPDPFGEKDSYSEYANEKLKSFLDSFNFEYEFYSASDLYKNGIFNEYLIKAAEKYQDLLNIMLPTLRMERSKTYSPFMPIENDTKFVIHEGVISVDIKKNTIKYINSKGKEIEQSFLNGGCKLQWKCDFGMRWAALDVDYELYGKDHYPNEKIYKRICESLGKKSPVNFFYELFLDENGEKISKSKGNGVTIEEWMKYSNKESLLYYMFIKPQTAKRLHIDVIPKITDEYLTMLKKYMEQDFEKQIMNPIFYIHQDNIPFYNSDITYSILLNLANVSDATTKDVLLNLVLKYDSNLITNNKIMLILIEKAINYYLDFDKNKKNIKLLDKKYLDAIMFFANELKYGKYNNSDEIQNLVYKIGNDEKFDLKNWFSSIYQLILGSETGPRIGSLVIIYGVENFLNLLKKNLLLLNIDNNI